MRNVIYETENSIFKFLLPDVINRLTFYSTKHNVSEATELLNLISSSPDDPVRIPEKNNYFRFVCLYLVDQGKGSVICKICRKSYKFNEIRIIRRTSGIEENLLPIGGKKRCGWLSWNKWINRIFSKEEYPKIGNFGAIGIQCEKGHELLSMTITWIS